MEGAQALAAAAREGRTRAYAALALCIAVLGCNWPVMTVGLRSFSPLWMSSLRLSVAAVTLFLFEAVRRGVVAPARQDLPIVASVAVFRLALVSAIVFVALQFVPPGRSSILVYTAAIWAVPISGWRLRERPGRVVVVGLMAGVAGLVLVVEPWRLEWSQRGIVLGYALLLAAAVVTASVTVHIRGHVWRAAPVALLPWQLGGAAALATIAAITLEGPPDIAWSAGAAVNILYQGACASGIAVWGEITVSKALPATSTHVGLMGVPVVGLLSSALVLGERLTPAVLAGLALIAGGASTSALAGLWEPQP